MKSVGLKLEFEIKIGECPRPLGVNDAVWLNDPNHFIFQNLLDNYSGITLAQVKATRDEVRATLNALDRVPTARDPDAIHFASKQHRSWNTHWIRIQEALEESFTEKFRLQVMEWSKNWRKQNGEGHDWTMMQFLAKVDLEYSRLLHLNQ
jgi:hypothetical protein